MAPRRRKAGRSAGNGRAGGGGGAAGTWRRGRPHPADPTQADLVRRAGGASAGAVSAREPEGVHTAAGGAHPQSRPPYAARIDEPPLPAQNQIRAKRGELTEEHPEKRRMSLLQRIASVDWAAARRSPKQHAIRSGSRRAIAGRKCARRRFRPSACKCVPHSDHRNMPHRNRSPNMPADRPRKAWTCMAGRLRRSSIMPRTISSTSRLSCDARPTNAVHKCVIQREPSATCRGFALRP